MFEKSLALAALIVTACSCAGQQYVDSVTAREYAHAIQLEVACLTPEGPSGAGGSGTIISSRHILTAWHVVTCGFRGEPTLIVATDVYGRQYELEVDKVLEKVDSVRLVVVGSTHPFRTWAWLGRPPKIGQKICMATAVPIRGRFCGEVQPPDLGMLRWSSVANTPFPGNSGSGLYDTSGRLVGMVTMSERCGQYMPWDKCGGRGWTIEDFSKLVGFPPDPSWFKHDDGRW